MSTLGLPLSVLSLLPHTVSESGGRLALLTAGLAVRVSTWPTV